MAVIIIIKCYTTKDFAIQRYNKEKGHRQKCILKTKPKCALIIEFRFFIIV